MISGKSIARAALLAGSMIVVQLLGLGLAGPVAAAGADIAAVVPEDRPSVVAAQDVSASSYSCLIYVSFEEAGTNRYRAGSLGGCTNKTFKIRVTAKLRQCVGACRFSFSSSTGYVYLGGGTTTTVRQNSKTCFGGGTFNAGLASTNVT